MGRPQFPLPLACGVAGGQWGKTIVEYKLWHDHDECDYDKDRVCEGNCVSEARGFQPTNEKKGFYALWRKSPLNTLRLSGGSPLYDLPE